MVCDICKGKTDLPHTRWIKQEIFIDDGDESCVKSTIYCDSCVSIRKNKYYKDD